MAKASPNITTARLASTVSIGSMSISGTKYQDMTGSGFAVGNTQQAQGGVTIDLYTSVPTGTNSGYVAQTTTASNGTFSFSGLTPGTYYVQEVVPSGYIQTGGGPNGSAGNTYYTVNVTATTADSGYSFDGPRSRPARPLMSPTRSPRPTVARRRSPAWTATRLRATP